tara:strand:+ start:250 stop:519 length:270 start_codon:yes stop_codon:yes gene_type:complete
MAKYYVESGNLQAIVESDNPLSACIKAFIREVDKWKDVDCGMLEFEDVFFVSEKGFLSLREEMTGSFQISIPEEQIYYTEDILGEVDGL